MTNNRIVTISRQFGSGGRTVGKQLAVRLRIPCYDQELIEKLAQASGFTPEMVAKQQEASPYSSHWAFALSEGQFMGASIQDQLAAAAKDYPGIGGKRILRDRRSLRGCDSQGSCGLPDGVYSCEKSETSQADCRSVW